MTLKTRRLIVMSALIATFTWTAGWTADAEAQPLTCDTFDRLTFNNVNDQWPDWEPDGERITFNIFSTVSSVPRDIGLVNADGSGYLVAADVIGVPWGTFYPRWGAGNTIVSAEHNVIHEYLTFDVSQAPFNRTVLDGSDAAFTRELFIPGGDGGGWIVVSADGSTAFWRWSSSGGAGTQQIRRGSLASLVGQAASSTGVVIQSIVASPAQYWIEPIALSPDGTLYINAERTAATSNTNLVMRQTSDGAVVRMLTNDAALGVAARGADFSPDGTKIAFTYNIGVGQWDLFVENLDGSDRVNITNTAAMTELYPTWGPNGERIAFTSSDGTDSEIYVCDLSVVSNQPPVITVNTDPLVLVGDALGGYDNFGGLTGGLADVSASDPDGDPVTLTNDAPALIPFGDTIVTWTADDGTELVDALQTVRVVVGQASFDAFLTKIQEEGFTRGLETSLSAKVRAAAGHFADGNIADAIASLDAFLNEVRALEGKKLTAEEADRLRACADALIGALSAP